jgi:integrase
MAKDRRVKMTQAWAKRIRFDANATTRKGESAVQEVYKDIATYGLELRLSPTSRVWRYQYRYAGGAPKRVTIGDADLMDYDEAKSQADAYRRELESGRDPGLLPYRPNQATTLQDVVEFYKTTLPSATSTRSNLDRVARKLLAQHGATPLINITRPMVQQWLDANMWRKPDLTELAAIQANSMPKSLYRKQGSVIEVRSPGMAVVLIRYMTAAFHKVIDPVSGLDMPADYHNPFSDMAQWLPWLKDHSPESYARNWGSEQWQEIMRGLNACYLAGRYKTTINNRSGPHPTGTRCLHLIMLTGTRPEEIQSLRWDQIEDYKASIGGAEVKLKRIIKDRHKTWGKTGRSRQIIVAKAGIKVLEEQRQWLDANGLGDSPWVFPSPGGKGRVCQDGSPAKPYLADVKDYTKALSQRCNLDIDLKTYNFRSAYINMALDALGMNWLEVVAENVGHANSKTTLKYYQRNRMDKLAEGAVRADEAFADMILVK